MRSLCAARKGRKFLSLFKKYIVVKAFAVTCSDIHDQDVGLRDSGSEVIEQHASMGSAQPGYLEHERDGRGQAQRKRGCETRWCW